MSPLNRKLSRRDLIEALSFAGAALVGLQLIADKRHPDNDTRSTTTGTAGAACVVTPENRRPLSDRTGMISNQAFFRQDIKRPGLHWLACRRQRQTELRGRDQRRCQSGSARHRQLFRYASGLRGTSQTTLRGVQAADWTGHVPHHLSRTYGLSPHPSGVRQRRRRQDDEIAFPESVSSGIYGPSVTRRTVELDQQFGRDGTQSIADDRH